MPYCGQCGVEISTPFCTNCGTQSTVEGPEPPQQRPAPTEEPAPRSDAGTAPAAQPAIEYGFHRTPFQVVLLDFVTFGVYTFFWWGYCKRLSERRLGMRISSRWTYLLLFVPLLNLFVFFEGFSLIGSRPRESGVFPSVPFSLTAVPLVIVSLLWRLPDPYWMVSIMSSIFLGAMHVDFNRAEMIDYPKLRRPRLSIWEWVMVVLGGGVVILSFIGTQVDVRPEASYFIPLLAVVVVVTLILYGVYSKRLRYADDESVRP